MAFEGAGAGHPEEVELILIVYRIGRERSECEVEQIVAVGLHESGELAIILAAADEEESSDAFVAEHLQEFPVLAFGVAEIVAIVRRVENRCAGDDDLKGRVAVDDFLPKPFDLRFPEHLWQAVAGGCIVSIATSIEHEKVDV